MQKADKIEYDKRIRIIQEWILDDWPAVDISTQILNRWKVEERQAKKYIAEARRRWNGDEDEIIEHKRKTKVASPKKLKRSLNPSFLGTPAGILAILAVEKEIILLEGLRMPTKIELIQPLSSASELSNSQFQQLLKLATESKKFKQIVLDKFSKSIRL